MADINPILAAAKIASQTNATNSAQIEALDNSRAEIAKATAGLELDTGANNVIIKSTQRLAELQTQNARLKIGALTGMDINQQGEQVSSLVSEASTAYATRMKMLKNIEVKDSVGFMDNPLGHIINQFTVNDDIQKHNAAAHIQNAATSRLEELTAESDALNKTQANYTQSVTQATIDAESKNTLNVAQAAANKVTIDSLGYNIEGLKTAMTATTQELQIKSTVFNNQATNQKLAIEAANYDLHKQSFELDQKIKTASLEDREANQQSDQFLIDRIQVGLGKMYGEKAPNLVASPKAARGFLTLLRTPGEAGEEARMAYGMGQTGMAAGNPASVINALKSGVALKFTPAQEPIQKLFADSVTEAAKLTAKDKDTATNNLNTVVMKNIKDMQERIEPTDINNIFRIPSIKDVLAIGDTANNPFAQKVLIPIAGSDAAKKLDDPNFVISAGLKAVQDKTITFDQYLDGAQAVYLRGTHTNIGARDPLKFGIIPTDGLYKYNVPVQGRPGAVFSGTTTVDMTNREELKRFSLKVLSNRLVDDAVFLPGASGMISATEPTR